MYTFSSLVYLIASYFKNKGYLNVRYILKRKDEYYYDNFLQKFYKDLPGFFGHFKNFAYGSSE